MRTTMPTGITPAQRRTVILGRIDKLQARAPDNWGTLDYQKHKDFMADVAQLQRLARSGGSFAHVLRIGARIARAYGVDMAQIDPCHGETA